MKHTPIRTTALAYSDEQLAAIIDFCEREITRRRNIDWPEWQTYAQQQRTHLWADVVSAAMGHLGGYADDNCDLDALIAEVDDVRLYRVAGEAPVFSLREVLA